MTKPVSHNETCLCQYFSVSYLLFDEKTPTKHPQREALMNREIISVSI